MMDHRGWSLAPVEMAMRINIQYPFVFKLYHEVVVRNPEHGDYPRDQEILNLGAAELRNMTMAQGYSEGCIAKNSLCGQKRPEPYECFFEDKLLFAGSYNATHQCGYWHYF